MSGEPPQVPRPDSPDGLPSQPEMSPAAASGVTASAAPMAGPAPASRARAPLGRNASHGLALAAALVAFDQASKWFFYKVVDLPSFGQIHILPFFKLTMVWNEGVSFGLLGAGSTAGRLALIAFALAVSALVARWLLRAERLPLALGLGLILGGAIGNVIDRIIHGRVFDFLDFSGLGFPWVFNVADSAICIGVAVLVWDTFFAKRSAAPL